MLNFLYNMCGIILARVFYFKEFISIENMGTLSWDFVVLSVIQRDNNRLIFFFIKITIETISSGYLFQLKKKTTKENENNP